MIRTFICLLLSLPLLHARDLHVGKDKDAPTIAHAIKLAQPGDTIHLEPKVYYDYAGFYGKKGEPGKPIRLDGHGATLDGSEPLDPAQWKEVSPGLFSHDDLIKRNDDAIMGRWFFLWDGKMNHMGRTSKGRSAPFKKPEDLQPGEWTFVKDTTREKPSSKQLYGTFYLKLSPGRTLAQANIRSPMRSAGVQMSGDNAHLIIRNVTATHVYNDGFNIHGDCRDCAFENIRAIECGDDGISAHESAEYTVDGFVSIGNSTGITDTVAAHTSYNRVLIAGCLGHDLFFLDDGRYKVTNAIVLSTSQNPFDVAGRSEKKAVLEMDNVLIRRLGPHSSPAQVATTAELRATRLTIEHLPVQWRGAVKLENSAINGEPVTAADAKGADVKAILATFSDSMRAEYERVAALKPPLEAVRLSDDNKRFVLKDSGLPFKPWGFNYLGEMDTILEEYWAENWAAIEEDFRDMRELGANVVRVHLQFATYMVSATEVKREELERLHRLLDLAQANGLYLDLTGLGCYRLARVPAWYDALDEDQRWAVQALFWQAIAEVGRGHPAVFCYDLMNEPVTAEAKPGEPAWLTGELGGFYFVQRLVKQAGKRTPPEIAAAWVSRMTAAIRKSDSEHLITVGVIPWAMIWPTAKPEFYTAETLKQLDFVSAHFYPQKGKVKEALTALKVYDLGRPLLIEETFPLSCSIEELEQFMQGADGVADGWISHYFGKSIADYRKESDMKSALIADFLAFWRKKAFLR